jgi:hypothetical protein
VLLRSSVVVPFRHYASSASCSAMVNEWENFKSMAHNLTAVLIQCFVRGCLGRMKLSHEQRMAKQFFRMIPLASRSASFTTSEYICLSKSSLRMVARTSELDQIGYLERLVSRSSEMIARKAETLAESHVAHLLGENSLLYCLENVRSIESQCLLRVAAHTKEARAGYPKPIDRQEGSRCT